MATSLRSLRRRAKEVAREANARLRRGKKTLNSAAVDDVNAALTALEIAQSGKNIDGLTSAISEAESEVDRHLAKLAKSKVREYTESIGVAVTIALLLRAFAFEAFQIPSESMVPTLLVGDYLFVAKNALGIRVPFTTRYLVRWGEIERGDIIVFVYPRDEVVTQLRIASVERALAQYQGENNGYPPALEDLRALSSADRFDAWEQAFDYGLVDHGYTLESAGADGELGSGDDLTVENSALVGHLDGRCWDLPSLEHPKDYIKRVIGLAGDTVEMRERVIYVNGEPFGREVLPAGDGMAGRNQQASVETMPEGLSYTVLNNGGGSTEFGPITVREDHVFVMGDNRDNSSDGRCWGQVPIDNVKGTSMFIFFSRDRVRNQTRWDRIFDSVR
ncbi:MAG: signal peptidase I [Bradymonadia bacterium]|jgi:signal peptidase I